MAHINFMCRAICDTHGFRRYRHRDVSRHVSTCRYAPLRPAIAARYAASCLYHRLGNRLVADLHGFRARCFILVKTEAHEIAFRFVEIVQVFRDLLFASFVVRIAAPDFELDDVLLPKVVDDDVGAGLVAGLGFDIVVADAVDDGFEVEQEQFSSHFLDKSIVVLAIDVVEVHGESGQQAIHVEAAVADELVPVDGSLFGKIPHFIFRKD